MSRKTNMIVIALGTAALAGIPLSHANAQSGDAVANAEQTCISNGVQPNDADFNTCVRRTAAVYDEGLADQAATQAVMVRNANDVCRSYGISPMTLGYKQCVGNELEKSTIASYNISYVPGYDAAPHATAAVDTYGFRYDAEGNVIDNQGYVIRAVPQ
jgi:hypothetical protein